MSEVSSSPRGPSGTRALILAIAFGVCTGLGLFTFQYAEGLSYLSTDPAACANCHIMQPQYDSWARASHHGVATCADCHLPHRGLAKWIAKADNGYRHSKAFTLQDFPEPIVMTVGNRRILQANCLECHEALVHDMTAGGQQAIECTHCHRDAGHGERTALGGPPSASDLVSEESTHD